MELYRETLMKSQLAICAAFLLLVSAGCRDSQTTVAPAAHASESTVATGALVRAGIRPTAEKIAATYSDLRLMTNKPVLVNPELAAFCIGISQRAVDDARKRAGPHAHTLIRIFMNDVAAAAFDHSAERYPVGSVVVKEKQGLEYGTHEPAAQHSLKTSDGVGGMIKRAAGYDPAHGDWEYFYFEDLARVEHGKIATCIECHRAAGIGLRLWQLGGQRLTRRHGRSLPLLHRCERNLGAYQRRIAAAEKAGK